MRRLRSFARIETLNHAERRERRVRFSWLDSVFFAVRSSLNISRGKSPRQQAGAASAGRFDLRIRCSIAFVLIAATVEVTSAPRTGTPTREQLDAIFSGLAHSQTPGFAVLVRRNGQTLFELGYGVRDLQSMQRIDARTNFRLASNSKQFTAMAIMLLVRDGKLRYDETLREVFPEFPDYGKTITIAQLLQHTSGLIDYEALMDDVEKTSPGRWSEQQQIRDDEVLTLLEQQRTTRFAPGSQWEYSNSGYVLLGLAVAKISGRPFPDFLHERIFAPLRMLHTVAYVKGRNSISNRAHGHSLTNGRWQQTDQSSTSATLGDGGIYSNLEDLARWDEALAQHRLLNAAQMQPALTPTRFAAERVTLPDDAPPSLSKAMLRYGFGWFLDAYREHPRMWHYGDTMGFKSAIQRIFPGHDTTDSLTIIVLANRTDLDPTTLALHVAAQFLEKN
jgi:CubicO group peptidase (beta-lactamase class C family)